MQQTSQPRHQLLDLHLRACGHISSEPGGKSLCPKCRQRKRRERLWQEQQLARIGTGPAGDD